MINVETVLNIADNSGGKLARCIKIYGGSYVKHAFVGTKILVSIVKAMPDSKIKKGKMYKALVVRTKKAVFIANSHYVEYCDNAIVLLNEDLNPIGTKIHGIISAKIKEKGYIKVCSIANEIL